MGMRKKGWIIILSLITLVGFLVFVFAEGIVGTAVISTDKSDYAPEETVLISGEGFTPNTPLNIQITRPEPDSTTDSCSVSSCSPRFINGLLTSDPSGSFSDYAYFLQGIDGTYSVLASDGVNSATTSFTDWYNDNNICTNDYWDQGHCHHDPIPNCCNCNNDCSTNNIPGINKCNNNPDSNLLTLDYRALFTSICNAHVCTTGDLTITHTCNVATCGATCDATHPCTATECDNLDGCVGSDYYNYNDVSNACLAGCTCENNACGNPTIIPNDPRCITPPSCGDGQVNGNEQCELPNTQNNIYCTQSTTSGCSGKKLGTRDDKGNCNGACGCVPDSFTYQCSQQCGASCAVDGDCTSGTCNTETCTCTLTEPQCTPADCNDQNPCTTDTCNTQGICEHTLNDNQGPVTSDVSVLPWFNNGRFNLTAKATDQCSFIQTAEYFIGYEPRYPMTCGADGTGTTIFPEDGSFGSDKLIEYLKATNVLVEDNHDGYNWVCVHSKDVAGNWGNCQCLQFQSDTILPDGPVNIKLDDKSNPKEYLICGNNPTLSAKVCDSQSDIQGGEYFIDTAEPQPWNGFWMNASKNWQEFLTAESFFCANISAIVNTTPLSEGTHYIVLHGKDDKENWGKVSKNISFIKDTKSPTTTKIVDSPKVQCQITTDGQNTVGECWYIQQGTHIHLSAVDPDTVDHEIAGLDKIMCQFRWKENLEDIWSVWSPPAECPNPIVFDEDSYHEIKYWAVDLCGNAEAPHYEIDIVDTQAPETTEEITGPKYVSGTKTYLDRETSIELTCIDGEPHPVDDVITLYARYNVDGGEWIPIPTKEGHAEFGFPEESRHTLEYYCVDALGNTEATHAETYYVDHTAPTTSLTYGTPFVPSEGYAKWITSATTITLSAVDIDTTGYGCNSGVAKTEYRVTQVEDRYCQTSDSGCSTATGSGDFLPYSSPFTIGQQSCHLVEYYSKDKVDKTETVKKECVFVDNTAPVFNDKQVGDPKVPCDEEEEDCDYYVTKNTQICLSATDQEPHPVEGVTISCNVKWWATDPSAPPSGTYPVTLNEQGCFKYSEDSYHELTCTATDALGNSIIIPLHEKDIVDTLPPTSSKVVGNPQYNNGEDDLFVKSTTPITFTCQDQTPHPVGAEKLCFKVSYDLTPFDLTSEYCKKYVGIMNEDWCCVPAENPFIFNFNEKEDSLHDLEYYCKDKLENVEKSKIEWDNVDDTPPSITIWNPTQDEASNIERCTQSIVVEISDVKSGVNESTIYAELYYKNNGTAVLNHKVSLKKSVYGTYEGLMDKQLPAGNYVLKIFAKDNVGNQQIAFMEEYLNETVFVEYIDPAYCNVNSQTGGSCDFTFHVCMRGDNNIQFWMNKLGDIITPDMMNAVIINGTLSAFVGLKHDGFTSDAGFLPLAIGCQEINGRTTFNLHLNLNTNVTQSIGPGVHDLNYTILSSSPGCPQ